MPPTYRAPPEANGLCPNPDFERVRSELDALYESHRLRLPLTGILLIGY